MPGGEGDGIDPALAGMTGAQAVGTVPRWADRDPRIRHLAVTLPGTLHTSGPFPPWSGEALLEEQVTVLPTGSVAEIQPLSASVK